MTLSTQRLERLSDQTQEVDAWAASFRHIVQRLFAGALTRRSELRQTKGGGEPPHSTRIPGLRLTWIHGLRGALTRMPLAIVAAVALVCAPQAAFAQRGGGGHGGGGGHFGGGGGHFGGGSYGGSRGYAPASGARSGGSTHAAVRSGTPPVTFVHGGPTAIWRGASPSSFARPAGPETGFATGIHAGEALRVPQHVTIGFPPVDGRDGFAVTDPRGAGAAGAAGWQPFAPVHGGNGGVLSFSGQGHEIWQDSSHNGYMGAHGSGAGAQAGPLESQRPRPFPPHRFHGGFFGPGYGYGYGYGFGGFYPWGFGLGLDFGAGCDPLWDVGCDAYGYPGYGYYGPYAPGLYLDSPSGDESAAAAPDMQQDSGVYTEQNTAPDNSADASTNGVTVLYLNDGTSFAVTDYWVADYKLHYVTDGARENAIDLDQIDVQRTVDENAARGVNFTLKPAAAAPAE